jgi:hypothetical protein
VHDAKYTLVRQQTGCRTSREGDCEASEGSFMCEDMLRAGYQHFVVDPGVRQAYFPDTARKLYTDQACLHHSQQMKMNSTAL